MNTPLAAAIAGLLISGCAGYQARPAATARLLPTQGNVVTGLVTFTKTVNYVLVSGEVQGLAPNTEHGFHVHEKGDCSSADAVSAGGHFNPRGAQHGALEKAEHHAGDLQSLKSDANGVARFSFMASALSVGEGAADVIGRGLIVHRDPDDFKTQPTGNAGPRLACAVIAKS